MGLCERWTKRAGWMGREERRGKEGNEENERNQEKEAEKEGTWNEQDMTVVFVLGTFTHRILHNLDLCINP